MADYDLVIAGGGIGGGALGTILARAGMRVLILEKTTEYPDLVRGEWFAPWGVLELQRLGLYDTLLQAGGHVVTRHVTFEPGKPAEDSLAAPTGLAGVLPNVPGALCIRHPVACQALTDSAAAAGAEVVRGARVADVDLDGTPSVTCASEGESKTVTCRLVVGADGRNSTVRRAAGIEQQHDPPHHLFSGLLVDGVEGLPEDMQTIGTEGGVHYLAFPQGGGRVRLYLGYPLEEKRLLAGKGAEKRFLEAFRQPSLPWGESISAATPLSECHSYPNEDTWTDEPYGDGVLLIGDAAGHNDPLIGQGLSITMRDVRIVSELLLGSDDWSPALLAPYGEERRERMRRLREIGRIQSILEVEFGPAAEERRARSHAARAADPSLMLPVIGAFVGPENVPPFAFEAEHVARVLSREPSRG